MKARERPSTHGALLGEALADIAKAGDVGLGVMAHACATCAFREGCMTNQMAATGIVALNCVLGIDPAEFACHYGMKNGQPARRCAGYLAALNAPWSVKLAALQTLSARLGSMSGPDEVRADFDEWIARHDPNGELDDYKRARLYAKELAA